jgi:acrylyl-CoA reductase (NADPH)
MERVRDDWIVPLPRGLELEDAMAIGTAGLTAMLALMALEQKGLTRGGTVVVSGAAGGVGSLAVALLAASGYEVVASTGRTSETEYLRSLGASENIDRSVLAAASSRPLESARWDGAIDTVGGDTLAGLLRTMRPHASVAACGNAGGAQLHSTVFPFILRGVSLLGIDSNLAPTELRRAAWDRLASELPRPALRQATRRVSLDQVPEICNEIVQGHIRGRVVVDVNTVRGNTRP